MRTAATWEVFGDPVDDDPAAVGMGVHRFRDHVVPHISGRP
jgi:hypothetical protein